MINFYELFKEYDMKNIRDHQFFIYIRDFENVDKLNTIRLDSACVTFTSSSDFPSNLLDNHYQIIRIFNDIIESGECYIIKDAKLYYDQYVYLTISNIPNSLSKINSDIRDKYKQCIPNDRVLIKTDIMDYIHNIDNCFSYSYNIVDAFTSKNTILIKCIPNIILIKKKIEDLMNKLKNAAKINECAVSDILRKCENYMEEIIPSSIMCHFDRPGILPICDDESKKQSVFFSAEDVKYAEESETTIRGITAVLLDSASGGTKLNLFASNSFKIKNVIVNGPATIVFWESGDKTIVKKQDDEVNNDVEKAIMAAFMKKALSIQYTAHERSLNEVLDSAMKMIEKNTK